MSTNPVQSHFAPNLLSKNAPLEQKEKLPGQSDQQIPSDHTSPRAPASPRPLTPRPQAYSQIQGRLSPPSDDHNFSPTNRRRRVSAQKLVIPLPHTPLDEQISSEPPQQTPATPINISPPHPASPKISSPHSPQRHAASPHNTRQRHRETQKTRSLATYFFSCLNCCIHSSEKAADGI